MSLVVLFLINFEYQEIIQNVRKYALSIICKQTRIAH